MANTLKAGIARADITPPLGVGLSGYPHHERRNTGAHDPLVAACLVLDDGSTTVAIVTLDILMISKRYVREIRDEASRRTGIPPGHIMISCSHSHSSPRASATFTMDAVERGQDPDRTYVETLELKVIDLIEMAWRDRFDAAVGIAKGFCGREQGVGGNRRDPTGIADPEVWTIGVKDSHGALRAVYVKYSLHPTFLHSDNLLVSADYPGAMRRYLESTHDGAVMLFAQGASGNQSPRYFRSGKTFAEAERVGLAVGKVASDTLLGADYRRDVSLLVRSTDVDIELRTLPPRAEAEAAADDVKAAWEAVKAAGAPEPEVWNAELRFLGAEDTLAMVLLREGEGLKILEEDLPVEVQVIGIGDTRIVGIQGELFVEYGLTIQYRAPFASCFVVELANGLLPGYAATASAYASGGYETGASLLTARSGEQLVDAAVALLGRS